MFRPRANRALGGAFAVAVALGAACKPHRGLDSNGSDPPDGGGAAGVLYANDPALGLWKQYGQTDRLVLAYTDESGAFDVDEITHRLVPKAKQSKTGVSFSSDYGKTWTRVGPLPLAAPDCTSRCAVALAGSPALSANENVRTVDLVSLAYTDASLDVPDAIAVSSTRDLVSWDPARIAVQIPGRPPSRPSFARRNSSSVIAFTDRPRGEIFMASSSFDPPAFDVQTITVGNLADDDAYKDRPILRLTTASQGHIAYIIPRSADGATFDLRMLHVWRDIDIYGNASPWNGSTIFAMNAVTIDPTLDGALGRAWRDAYPFTVAVGDSGKHLYLAYRQRSTVSGVSEIFFFDCDSTDGGNCAIDDGGQLTGGWRVRHYAPTTYTGGQYLPVLAADIYGKAAALSWLQETAPGSGTFTLMGTYTTDSGDHMTAPADLRAGNGGPWKPCPTASEVAAGVHSYGERSAQIVVPWDESFGPKPTIVTAHVDSTYGCQDMGELTFDQHIGVATW